MDSGNDRQQALQTAQRALERGDWRSAARELERAAALARTEGDEHRAAHCLQMAASLHRASGDSARAIDAAQRAGTVGGDERARFAALAERGETLMAEDRPAEAAPALREALACAAELQLPAWAQSTVMRRLAEADAGRGALDQAWLGYDAAARLLAETGDRRSVAWVDLEHANRAWQVGDIVHAQAVLDRPRVQAFEVQDAHLHAERQLLLARLHMARGAHAQAATCAGEARLAALEAVAPLTYYGATVALAQAREAGGDRVAAYTVLATAWVTLGDLLGRELAESWVGPILEACRLRWGAPAFAEVKAAHDSRRSRQRQGGP